MAGDQCRRTPAQYFHVLRRQIHRKFRKPLVLMMPKALLRYEPASSRIEEFTDGAVPARDRRCGACADPHQRASRAAVQRQGVLHAARKRDEKQDEKRRDDVAIVRVEQLYPFPQKEIAAVLAQVSAQAGSRAGCRKSRRTAARGRSWSRDWRDASRQRRAELRRPRRGRQPGDRIDERCTRPRRREIVAAALEIPAQSQAAHEATKPGTAATAKSQTAVSG